MHPYRKTIAFILVIMMAMAGCNLPGVAQPTAFVFSTPTTGIIPVSSSVPVDQPLPTSTNAPVVTATLSPVTNTNIPLATNTSTATQIPSSTPTSTPAATSTKTQVPRTNASAAFLKPHPDMDGVWDEWTTPQYPITDVTFGRSNWSDKADLQASYRVGWDNQFLFLAIKVYDDKYEQLATGANLYLGDSIELLFSSNPNADSQSLGLTAHDYQIGISPGFKNIGEDTEAYLWFPKNKAGDLSSVTIGAVPMKGGYRIEFAIPWSVLGVTPAKGQVFGFAVSVSDNDNSKQAEQQSMISSVPHRNLVDPTSWGLLTLK